MSTALPARAAAVAVVFLVAFALRLIAVFQYADAPNFDNPIGDSLIYVERARAILEGNLLGDGISFHSAPLYPYFVALGLRLADGGLFGIRIVQAALGALGCVTISLLARRLAGGSGAAQWVAGLAAAFYGTLAFFDVDLLMASLTVLCVGTGLLFLARAQESGSMGDTVLAGVALGLAATDKPNLLLFVPVAAWILVGSLPTRPGRRRWVPALAFVAAAGAMILPITARNLVVGQDFVLVSSNAGVNLYIGNNEAARGTFSLPRGSGLRNTDLHGSSVAVAERALGPNPKPSRVSRFWAARAGRFVVRHPFQTTALVGRKLRRLVSAYELPNHLNFYYMRTEFIPVLRWLWVGAWLVFPLAAAGIAWRVMRGATALDRLLLGFLAAYSVSLLPFFVTARYRLPLVPVLIVYASVWIVGFLRSWPGLSRPQRVVLGAALVGSVLAVHWPAERFGYAFDRVAMATKYFDRASSAPLSGRADIEQTIVQLKWAAECDPASADAHYNLGVAYESVGYYSGAAERFERALRLDPGRYAARVALNGVRAKLARRENRVDRRAIPQTPFERAQILERSGAEARAEQIYLDLIRDDPFHFAACSRLGQLYERRGERDRAVVQFERAASIRPADVGLLTDLARAYDRVGRRARADSAWRRCLAIDPDHPPCVQGLRATGEAR